VLKAGKKYSLAPTGPSDIRRIEAGILNYGIDMTLDDNPYEVGLERLVHLDKPAEFIGREALAKIRKDGVKKRLVGVEIGGKPMDMNMTRYPVKGGGFITSCVYSPRLKKNIGYCWLPTEMAKDGTKIKVESEWGPRTATVVPMPFVDPDKRIPVS
jgi:aminomethyltransferase